MPEHAHVELCPNDDELYDSAIRRLHANFSFCSLFVPDANATGPFLCTVYQVYLITRYTAVDTL